MTFGGKTMGSFARRAGGIGAVAAAGAALTLVQAPAHAQARRQTFVPCSSPSLAAAINAANLSPATLRLAANCTYDVATAATPADALPVITGDVHLVGGPSTVIRRNPIAGSVRLFGVASTGVLRIDGIFLMNGAPANLPGGAIEVLGTLTLNQVTLTGNTSGTANGGGVDVATGATATINRSVITENTSTGMGGGVNNSGHVLINDSRLSANGVMNAAGGGGLFTETGATSNVVGSTLDHNTTTGSGGGIANLGTTLVDHTLIERNAATTSGGGIFKLAGTVTVTTSTVRLNTPNNCFPLNTIPGCTN